MTQGPHWDKIDVQVAIRVDHDTGDARAKLFTAPLKTSHIRAVDVVVVGVPDQMLQK